MQVCSYFLAGFCAYGPRCKFAHLQPDGTPIPSEDIQHTQPPVGDRARADVAGSVRGPHAGSSSTGNTAANQRQGFSSSSGRADAAWREGAGDKNVDDSERGTGVRGQHSVGEGEEWADYDEDTWQPHDDGYHAREYGQDDAAVCPDDEEYSAEYYHYSQEDPGDSLQQSAPSTVAAGSWAHHPVLPSEDVFYGSTDEHAAELISSLALEQRDSTSQSHHSRALPRPVSVSEGCDIYLAYAHV